MNNKDKYPHISTMQQDQMLKLITKSFYNELVNYGISKGNVISISSNLLDCVLQTGEKLDGNCEYYNSEFSIKNINDEWGRHKNLGYQDVSLAPIEKDMCSKIASWLSDSSIKDNLVSEFPATNKELQLYFEQENNQYFAILHKNNLEGVIGADNIDFLTRKVEMRKFIGNFNSRGKGVGKQATFLFLYFVFSIMKFNKVYLYTLNKNIANINLNSKFGFILEGMLYQDIKIQNEIQDILRMCILKHSWDEMFMKISSDPT